MGFTANSAGGLMAGYVAWVLHPLRPELFTPQSIVLFDQQAVYPVLNPLSRTWGLWASALGAQHSRLALHIFSVGL